MNENRVLTLDEAAEYIRCGRTMLYELCRQKKIPYFKIGNRRRFLKAQLDEWIAQQTTQKIG